MPRPLAVLASTVQITFFFWIMYRAEKLALQPFPSQETICLGCARLDES